MSWRDATRHRCLEALEHERQWQAHFRTKGTRLPPGATFADCLFALAKRLGVYTRDCDPKANPDGVDFDGPWKQMWESVGEKLMLSQPEFWTLFGASGPGRPSGAGNKQLDAKPSKGTLRQRRRRQKKRDKYSS
jgi:hypothetical protein